MQRLVHLSDVHIGRNGRARAAEGLVSRLVAEGVEHVVVSGDLTEYGRRSELETFERIFAPLADRLTLVPGNHDRVGQDAGARLMQGERVLVDTRPGLHLVRVDSTGPHNKSFFNSHGRLCAHVIHRISEALDAAPFGALRVVVLHHHVLPLPEESPQERFASLLGWPHALELALGPHLVESLLGRADLVLHGHRHVPSECWLACEGHRPLAVFNAGSSTSLGAARVFHHHQGRLHGAPRWMTLHPARPEPRVRCEAPRWFAPVRHLRAAVI